MDRFVTELLLEATSDAPPLRHSTDEVVAESRRLARRHRNRLVTGTAGAVVAASVAAALVVPGPDREPAGRPPSTGVAQGASSPAPRTFTYPAEPFAFGFRGYRSGRWQVTDPAIVTPGFQEAYVQIPGEMQVTLDQNDNVVSRTQRNSAYLTVFRPGAFTPSRFDAAEAVTVGGRPGRYAANVAYHGDSTDPEARPGLAWQYADNAWAVIVNPGPTKMTRDEMTAVADGLTGADPYPPAVAFRPGWLPNGFHLTAAGRGSWDFGLAVSVARVVARQPDYRDLADTIDMERTPIPHIDLRMFAAEPGTRVRSGPARCDGDLCQRLSPDGKWLLEVIEDTSELGPDVSRRILDEIQLAPVDSPDRWFTATQAFPP